MNFKSVKKLSFSKLAQSPIVISLFSLILSLVVSGIIMAFAGFSPLEAYGAMFVGAFGGLSNFADTLGIATPLIFTGLAVTIAMRGGILNVGCEGQLYIGGMAAALTGAYVKGLPAIIHIPICFLAAMLAGGLWAVLAGVIKIRANANEVIITIMLNYIAIYLTDYLASYVFKADGMVVKTNEIMHSAVLPQLYPHSRLTIGLLFALLAMVFIAWILKSTILGYNIRALGQNPYAAEAGGIRKNRMILFTFLLSGALAGMAGAIEVQGVHTYFISNFSNGYGWDGLATSVLGQYNPFGTVLASLFYGAMRNGATMMDRMTKMPPDFVVIMQALAIIFIATPSIIRKVMSIFAKRRGQI